MPIARVDASPGVDAVDPVDRVARVDRVDKMDKMGKMDSYHSFPMPSSFAAPVVKFSKRKKLNLKTAHVGPACSSGCVLHPISLR
jgi:hypothetical protein